VRIFRTLAVVIFSALVALTGAGCSVRNVRPVDAHAYPITVVCIQENPKVVVPEFVTVIEEGFARHGIRSRRVHTPAPADCEYTVSYTARQSWDFVPYLRSAELRLAHGDETIGTATYYHRRGLAPSKWAGARSKMAPVMDELLSGFPPRDGSGSLR